MINIVEFLVKKHQQKLDNKFGEKEFKRLKSKPIKYNGVKIDIYKRTINGKDGDNVKKYSNMTKDNYTLLFDYLYTLLDEIDANVLKNIKLIQYYNVGGSYGGFTFNKGKTDNVCHIYYGGLKDEWTFSIHDNHYTSYQDTSEDIHEEIIYKFNQLFK